MLPARWQATVDSAAQLARECRAVARQLVVPDAAVCLRSALRLLAVCVLFLGVVFLANRGLSGVYRRFNTAHLQQVLQTLRAGG